MVTKVLLKRAKVVSPTVSTQDQAYAFFVMPKRKTTCDLSHVVLLLEDRGLDAIDANELQNQDLRNVIVSYDAESDAYFSELTDSAFLRLRWPNVPDETIDAALRLLASENGNIVNP